MTKPEDADEDDEEAQQLEEKLDMAGQYVEVIEEELIPEATSRYLGFFDDMGDYGDEGMFGDDDDDEDGDDADDKPKPKKGKKKGDNAATDAGDDAAGDGEKKECKQ